MKWIFIALASLFVSCDGAGLANKYNYCRYNSVIQLFFYTPQLREAVLNSPGDLKIEIEKDIEIDIKGAITQLADKESGKDKSKEPANCTLYPDIQNEQDPAVYTLQEILKKLDLTKIAGIGTMDYRETTLANGTILKDFIFPPLTEIPYNIATVDKEFTSGAFKSLQDYLDRGFLFSDFHSKTENPILAKRPYTRNSMVRQTKAVMLISLAMYGQKFADGKVENLSGAHLQYEETLKIRALSDDGMGLIQKTYNLVAVLFRAGLDPERGHFFTYAKTSTGQWKIFNDDNVQDTTVDAALSLKSTFLLLSYVEDPLQRQVIAPDLISLDFQGLEYLRKTLPINLQLHFTYDGRLHRYMHYDNSSGLLDYFETTDLVNAKGRMASAEFIPAVTVLDNFGKNLADSVCVVFEQLVEDAIPANKTCGAITAIVDSTRK